MSGESIDHFPALRVDLLDIFGELELTDAGPVERFGSQIGLGKVFDDVVIGVVRFLPLAFAERVFRFGHVELCFEFVGRQVSDEAVLFDPFTVEKEESRGPGNTVLPGLLPFFQDIELNRYGVRVDFVGDAFLRKGLLVEFLAGRSVGVVELREDEFIVLFRGRDRGVVFRLPVDAHQASPLTAG